LLEEKILSIPESQEFFLLFTNDKDFVIDVKICFMCISKDVITIDTKHHFEVLLRHDICQKKVMSSYLCIGKFSWL